MRDLLMDATFGAAMVATGVVIGWFGVTLGAPAVGAIGAIFAVIGVFVASLEIVHCDGAEESAQVDGGTPGISLSSAPESVRDDVPSSSKLVWMYMAAEGESTLDDIVDGTQLTPRTARNAITRLERVGAVTKRPADQGTCLRYDVRDGDEAASTAAEDE